MSAGRPPYHLRPSRPAMHRALSPGHPAPSTPPGVSLPPRKPATSEHLPTLRATTLVVESLTSGESLAAIPPLIAGMPATIYDGS